MFLSLIDSEGKIMSANAFMLKTLHLGNPRKETYNILNLLHPEHIDPFRQALKNSQKNGSHSSTELYMKNGYYHPVKWNISYIGEINGLRGATFLCTGYKLIEEDPSVPNSTVSNCVDVTREKKLFSGARESDTLFHSFMNRTPNLAWVLDENATLLFASRSWYKYFGLCEETATGKNIFELVPASVAEGLNRKHRQVLETGEAVETDEKVKWADGSSFVFHINIFPVEGADGKRMVGGHAVNLSDKHIIQKQLREANDRLLLLSRTTTDAIWEWDMQTGKIFRNDALMDMIGYHIEEPKGLSWWLRRIHPEDRERVSETVKESTDKNLQSWQQEYRFKCADGIYKHMRDKGFIVYENGLPVKMIGSLQDISDIRNLENELLEEKLQRQKEISETVIRVQEKERTRIGHELHDNVNQILSTTKLFVDMLTPVSKEEKQIKQKSIEYLLMAIEEIRKLSRELVTPQLKEKKLVENIRQLIDDICLSSSIRIQFSFDHEIDLLSTGKKLTFFRIVQEQLKNILKYSQAEKVDINLMCRDAQAILTIKDNGVGFDLKQPARGIGLSNIHERARFYNGGVKIETSKGKGCKLEISLPLHDI
ncbi:MAG: PAS domain-containing protein [Bacteroidota bacterium]